MMKKSERQKTNYNKPKLERIYYTIPKDNWKYNNMGMYVNTVPYPTGISRKKVRFIDNVDKCLIINIHDAGITFFAEKELDTFPARMTIYSSNSVS